MIKLQRNTFNRAPIRLCGLVAVNVVLLGESQVAEELRVHTLQRLVHIISRLLDAVLVGLDGGVSAGVVLLLSHFK